MKSNANVAANVKAATRRCASERRWMVLQSRNSTAPVCTARVASTACEYSVSICPACVCTCDANSEESAGHLQHGRLGASDLVGDARQLFRQHVALRHQRLRLVASRESRTGTLSRVVVGCGTSGRLPASTPAVSRTRGGGARLRLRSASASTFLNRTSLHWSNADATFASRSVTMRTTPAGAPRSAACPPSPPRGPARST